MEEFASSRHFDFQSPTMAEVLTFLQVGSNGGLSYNILKVHISAPSAPTSYQWSKEPEAIKIHPLIQPLFPIMGLVACFKETDGSSFLS